MSLLVDTNVVSEIMAPDPNPNVVSALSKMDRHYLSVVTVHELNYGIERLPTGKRQDAYRRYLKALIDHYGDRILNLDRTAVSLAAEWRVERERMGRPIPLGDALIAGTALANRLAVLTRNVSDFEGGPITVIDPWQPL